MPPTSRTGEEKASACVRLMSAPTQIRLVDEKRTRVRLGQRVGPHFVSARPKRTPADKMGRPIEVAIIYIHEGRCSSRAGGQTTKVVAGMEFLEKFSFALLSLLPCSP